METAVRSKSARWPSVIARPVSGQGNSQSVARFLITLFTPTLLETISRFMQVELLFEDRLCLAVSKQGPWGRRRKIDLSELVNERWVTVPLRDLGGRILEAAFDARGLKPPHITVTTYSVNLRKYLAETARFIAVIPKSMLTSSAATLKELPIALPMPRWTLAVVRLKNRSLNPLVGPFIECARATRLLTD